MSKKELAAAIVEFLQKSIDDKTISEDNQEGIQVAIDCIKESFGSEGVKSNCNLEQIFNVFTKTREQAAGTPSAPKATPKATPPAPSATPEDIAKSEDLKSQGNKLLASKKFEEAIEKYTEAINLYETAVYYSNRAAAYSQCGRHEMAASDARKALEIDPSFAKAFSRLGHAEFCLGNYVEAVEAYQKGLEKDPANQSLKQSLAAAEAKARENTISTDRAAPMGGMPGMPGMGGMPDFNSIMSDPNFMNMAQSMMNNPAMAGILNNPALANMMGSGGMPDMASLMNNPQIAQMAQSLMSDPNAMSSLMNNPDLKKMADQYMKK